MCYRDRRDHRGNLHKVRGEAQMRVWQYKHDLKILEMLDDGLTPKYIAAEMNLTIWAVYKARERMSHVKQKNTFQKVQKTSKKFT